MINKEMYLQQNLFSKVDKLPSRDGYGKGLVFLGEKNKNVVVLCCDLTDSTRSLWFKQKFPERFIQVGVAEQNTAVVASGLANYGKIPFISSYAMFSPGRNWEQIRTTIGYNNVSVKIAGAHAGISVGPDGATHQAIEDIAIMRPIANMTIICPCDAIEAEKATIAATEINGPVYLRFGREKIPVITTEKTPFVIGKAEILREGKDATIISCGVMVYESIIAAEELAKENIDVRVINCHTIKPLDRETIILAARETGCLVTAEEHQIMGGLGSAVSEVVSEIYPVPIKRVGVQNRYGESGEMNELMAAFGLTSKEIILAVKESYKLKNKNFNQDINISVLLKDCSSEKVFHTSTGLVLRNVIQLFNELKDMNEKTVSEHVTSKKNDFAKWIQDVFGDFWLAKALELAKTKEEMLLVLKLRLGQ